MPDAFRSLTEFLSTLTQLQISGAIDILLVALIFFWLLSLIQRTRAMQLFRGVIFLILIAVVASNVLRLTALSWLIRNTFTALLVAVPIIFQPELRQALERLGRTRWLIGDGAWREASEKVGDEIVRASQQCSERRWGALIVLEGETGLQEYVETGVAIDGKVSAELLLTIFHPQTALHDGAVIIRGDVVAAASCILPLSEVSASERHLGTRHRAAIGVTQESDAISVVVSEETGVVSLAYERRLVRGFDQERLKRVLRKLYRGGTSGVLPSVLRVRSRNQDHKQTEADHVAPSDR
jgi:diadenylate cyclase